VVELDPLGKYVAVSVRSDGEVPLADVLADPRPWDAGEVEEGDSAITWPAG
jgi:hypothetical protein